jgi:hypothetical protein
MKLTKRILLFFFLWGAVIYAQSSPVSIITAPVGSTLTNCGTPTLPSICVVAGTGTGGVYIWQTATLGWQLWTSGSVGPAGPAGATGPQGPTGPAGSGGVASVNGKTGAVVLGATTTLQ